jgi:LPXTG-site transpeptidase (sortase) family protein
VPTFGATPRASSPPVKIRIPTLRVTRSVIELPRIRDRHSGAWTWNTNRLFRSGRPDLVGHSEGSANPGQEGNMILVGHNYGVGYRGVFVGLSRLRPGDKVQVVSKAGETFTYRVETVKRVKWQRKSFGELTQHLNFLAVGGPERLTLVSCAGADFEPFPERVYVVAEPVH